MKIRVALQTPVAEIILKAEEVGHSKATLKAGYKRFGKEESATKLKELGELTAENTKLYATKPRPLVDGDPRFEQLTFDEIEEIRNWSEASETDKKASDAKINAFIKDNIVYLKDVRFEDEVTGKEMQIPDTRTPKVDEANWKDEGYASCLEWLLDSYLDSIWADAILTGLYSVLLNRDFVEDAKRKNFTMAA